MFVPRFVSGAVGRRVVVTQLGFSLPELIAVMVVVTIIAAVGAPKFWGSGFDEVKLQQQTLAALRYAQRFAVAQQRTVCITFTATTATLTYDIAYGSVVCGATGLIPPGGGTAPFTVTAPGTATYSSFPVTPLRYDRTGQPSAAPTITITGSSLQIVVEATTGYVH